MQIAYLDQYVLSTAVPVEAQSMMTNAVAHHPLGQFQSSDCPSPANSPPLFKYFLTVPHGMKRSFGQFRLALLVLPPPSPLRGQAAWGDEMPLALCSAAQHQLEHQCATNTALLPELKHSIIPDNMKKSAVFQMKLGHLWRWDPRTLKIPVCLYELGLVKERHYIFS